MFASLHALYRHKTRDFAAEGVNGKPSAELLLWMAKTAHLTDDQVRQGVQLLEKQEADARRSGEETWPPAYAAFYGLATMRTRPRDTREALPPRADKAVAERALSGIREMLGNG